jgi:hypothetical protein
VDHGTLLAIIVDEASAMVLSTSNLRQLNMILYHPSTTEATMANFVDVDFPAEAKNIAHGLARHSKAKRGVCHTTYRDHQR